MSLHPTATPVDEITMKKLILVKELFQRASQMGDSSYSYVDRVLAMVGFDVANETMVKVIISCLDSEPSPNEYFHPAVKKANELLVTNSLPQLTDVKKIKHIHKLRNDSQHSAKYPNEHDVNDARTYTRDFLAQTALNTWKLDFEKISLIDLVESDEVRGHLNKSSDLINNGLFTEATVAAVTGFETAKIKIKAPIFGRNAFQPGLPTDGTYQLWQDVRGQIETAKNLVMYSIVGIDYKLFRQFRMMTSCLRDVWFKDGTYYYNIWNRDDMTENEAKFTLDFTTGAVLKMQALVGDIEKPFNIDSVPLGASTLSQRNFT